MKSKTYILIFFVLLVILVLGFYTFSLSLGAVRVDIPMAIDGTAVLQFTHSRSNDVLKGQPACISVLGNVIHTPPSCDMSREKWADGIIAGTRECGFVPEKDKDWYCNPSYEHHCFEHSGHTFAGDCVDGRIKNYCIAYSNEYCGELGLGYKPNYNECRSTFDILINKEITQDSYFKVNDNALKDLTFDGVEVCGTSTFEILRPLSIEIYYKFKEPTVCPPLVGFKIEDKKCLEASGCGVVYDTEQECKIKLWWGLASTFVVANIIWILIAKAIVGVLIFYWVRK